MIPSTRPRGNNRFSTRSRRQPGCAHLGDHTAAPEGTALARHIVERGVADIRRLDEFCVWILSRILSIQALLVSQKQQCIGIDQVGHQRGKSIVVTKTYLFRHYCVFSLMIGTTSSDNNAFSVPRAFR